MWMTTKKIFAGSLLALCLPIYGQSTFTIDAFEHNGQLSWSNYPSAVKYTVEWTSDLESGQWQNSWSNLNEISPSGTYHTVEVPLFYRVVVEVFIDMDDDGWSPEQGDCDDTDPDINPDAVEIWYDGIDQNCDGGSDYDQDGDGYDSDSYDGSDCDDTDPNRNPGAPEICGNLLDDNCDGQTDETCP